MEQETGLNRIEIDERNGVSRDAVEQYVVELGVAMGDARWDVASVVSPLEQAGEGGA